MIDAQKILKSILYNKNVQQLIWLYIGLIVSIVLGIANSVLTARWLGPVQFGDFRYVTNVLMLFSSLLQMGVYVSGSRLIAIEHDQEKLKSLNGTLVIISLILSVFFTICILMYSVVQSYTQQQNLSKMFICLSPLLFGYQFKTLFEYTLVGNNNIKALSILQFTPQLFFLIIFFLTGYVLVPTTLIALFIQISGLCVVSIIFIIYFRKHYSFSFIKETFEILYKQNKKYGMQVYIGSVFNVATQYLFALFLSFYNSNNINVGFYTLAITISSPLTLMASSVGSVYYKQFATITAIPKKVLYVTVAIALLVYLIYAAGIKYIVILLYSKEYLLVANYAVILAFGNILHGFGDIFNQFLGSKGKGVYLRNSAMLAGTIILLGNVTIVYYYNSVGAVTTKILSDVGYLFGLLYYYNKYQMYESKNTLLMQ